MLDNLSPLRKPNKLTEIITDKIREMIEEGVLKPGDKLPTEKELCEGFGVGRSSVREALQGLEYMGLIESRPGVGRFLSSDSDVLLNSENWRLTLDQASVFELMEARRILEVSAVELAAQRATDEVIANLENILDVMREVMDSDMDLFFEKELELHLALAAACENSVLTELINSLIRKVSKHSERFLRTLPYTFERTVDQFDAIIKALKEGDPVLAREKMDEHLDLVRYALGKEKGHEE
ncbi:MAG TPA: FadR/GntR family transcriptional regulator [Bacillota bacterium]|nr:FadR family transcriptional regulator [Candidatus Fermentithermobacillaceae bacterium]HOB30558.1 FadR/GntR family transcriptional regulator [Bacillota bacterium]HOK64424.1 FadR/GntR family transcriptional regulator [Bacillota bacterium]HOL11710.1 FadR/GntR family transcriptional regulator [Bacillota bacterium]HOQ02376.1 FadR/GntR family transcriptional regulator [Bacillota bacterium]